MKSDRQLKILEIVGENDIRTQEELTEALRRLGFVATQATISRDIKELRLQKVTTELGTIKYAVPKNHEQAQKEKVDKYRSVLHQVLTSAVPAGNIGVLKTLSGTANAAAAALEEMNFNDLIGTLAGDDTLLCLFASDRLAFDFCKQVNARFIDGADRDAVQ